MEGTGDYSSGLPVDGTEGRGFSGRWWGKAAIFGESDRLTGPGGDGGWVGGLAPAGRQCGELRLSVQCFPSLTNKLHQWYFALADASGY